MRPHKKLKIWRKIIEMIKSVYSISGKLPKEELYGLTSQIRRAAVSVASNIAEGSARKSAAETLQFYSIAKGSLSEIDAQFEIAFELRFISAIECNSTQSMCDEVSRMLQGMINKYETL